MSSGFWFCKPAEWTALLHGPPPRIMRERTRSVGTETGECFATGGRNGRSIPIGPTGPGCCLWAGMLVAGRLFMRRGPIVGRALRAYLNNRAAPIVRRPASGWRSRHVQAERPDHEQNSRGDDGEIDAIHARQSRWLGHRSYVTLGEAALRADLSPNPRRHRLAAGAGRGRAPGD